MPGWRLAMSLAVTGGVPRRAATVALIVGSVLNAINQGDALVAGRPLDWLKLILTFLVPYCVSTHGAVTAKLAERSR
jgi:hypothetical protein